MHQKQVILIYFIFGNILNRIILSSNQINFHGDFGILVLEAVVFNQTYYKGAEAKIPLELNRFSNSADC